MNSSPHDEALVLAAPDSRPRRTVLLIIAALVLAMLAPILRAAPAEAATSIPPRTSTEINYALAVGRLLNTERHAHHLPSLSWKIQLINSARGHDVTMARDNTMSHQLRGEAALGTRIDRAGYDWTWAGENIGWNSQVSTAGVLALERAMYNEHAPNDGHRLNILNGHFTNFGVDVYIDRAHHKVWLTVDFGRR